VRKACDLSPAIERILDAARWAPSGDNAQPWRFEVRDDDNVVVCIRREVGNVYEYRDGEPTLLSAGALLENMAVAAPTFGKSVTWRYQGSEAGEHRIRVQITKAPNASPDPLFSQIYQRSVDRRPYRMEPLASDKKLLLAKSVDEKLSVEWFETLGARWKIATLTGLATNIRLRIPETFAIHRRIVDWDHSLSPAAIPSRALGVDALTLKAMRWLLTDRKRTNFANRVGSPYIAGLQMDTVPGIFSSAYVAVRLSARSHDPEERVSQLLRAGQSLQRFWLTATSLGLAIQPCLAALAFAHYGHTGEAFTICESGRRLARKLAQRANRVLSHPEEIVFLCRVGLPNTRKEESRSTRLPLTNLVRNCTPLQV
jgi:sulfur-carrier protein adenylyltransferase/sulfurtransferase